MSDTVQFPITQMSEKARTMHNETSNLAGDTSSHIQQMQQHHSSLPSSMQGPFGDFIDGVQQRMSNGLNMRTQISKLLGDASNAADGTDTNIASGFTGFTD